MAYTITSPRSTTNKDIISRYRHVRGTTLKLCENLTPEDMVVQACVETSPTKWHLAHTTWFFETFVLEAFSDSFKPYDPAFRVLFNSYYQQVGDRHPRPKRGLLTRPGLGEVMAYRNTIDERLEALLASLPEAALTRVAPIIELGLNHEEQHQELILMDIKRLLHSNPVEPAYAIEEPAWELRRSSPEMRWIPVGGGLHKIGTDGQDGFAYDNETPRHKVYVEPFEIASRLVTNAEFIRFIEDGGYTSSAYWLDEGWSRVCEEGWTKPLYWERDGCGQWTEFTLHGRRLVEPHAPVTHLSFFEADAYAKWAGARLPTEAEWECAAASRWSASVRRGNFLDTGHLHPRPMGDETAQGLAQIAGDAWEWTRSAHEPYPRYRAPEGAIGEYNGKFMCGSFVLRGGSCVTPRDHIRLTYRNFFHPESRWAFTSIRLARACAEHEGQRPTDSIDSDRLTGASDHEEISITSEPKFENSVREGLSREPGKKSIPAAYLYDARGGELFAQICETEAYYIPEVERSIMDEALPHVSRIVGPGRALIEPGAGDGTKALYVLEALDRPRAFIPIDVDANALSLAESVVGERFPGVEITPIVADFKAGLRAAGELHAPAPLLFFPGSSIGNMHRADRVALLMAFAETIGENGVALVSFDMVKDQGMLVRAYDDPEGVSAAFGLNLIDRLNREFDADLDIQAFHYEGRWDEQASRIEMSVVSDAPQRFTLDGADIELQAGERIVTEYSYKFTADMIEDEARAAGLELIERWSDDEEWFSVCLLRKAGVDPR